eukprot:gene10093-biopygen1637
MPVTSPHTAMALDFISNERRRTEQPLGWMLDVPRSEQQQPSSQPTPVEETPSVEHPRSSKAWGMAKYGKDLIGVWKRYRGGGPHYFPTRYCLR